MKEPRQWTAVHVSGIDVDPARLLAELRSDGPTLFVVNVALPIERLLVLLEAIAESEAELAVIGVAGRHERERLGPYVERDLLWYVSERSLEPAQLSALIDGIGRRAVDDPTEDMLAHVERTRLVFMQSDLDGACRAAAAGLAEILPGSDTRCYSVDASSDTLRWLPGPRDEAVCEAAASGLVGFVARSGRPVNVGDAEADPRYDADLDDPDRRGLRAFLARPLQVSGATVAVLVGQRSAGAFQLEEEERVETFVRAIEPAFAQLLVISRAAARTRKLRDAASIFREEAVEAHGRQAIGKPLTLGSVLTRHAMAWMLLVVAVTALVLFGVTVPVRARVVTSRHDASITFDWPGPRSPLREGDSVDVEIGQRRTSARVASVSFTAGHDRIGLDTPTFVGGADGKVVVDIVVGRESLAAALLPRRGEAR